MHGIGFEKAVDFVRPHDFGFYSQLGKSFREAFGRIFRRKQAAELPFGIAYRLRNRVPAIDDGTVNLSGPAE